MIVYGKELTDKEARNLIKITKVNSWRDFNIHFDHESDYNSKFDEALSTIPDDDIEVTEQNVIDAITQITNSRIGKPNYYAAYIMQGSELSNVLFEYIVTNSKDYEVMLAYAIYIKGANLSVIGKILASEANTYYNLDFILRFPEINTSINKKLLRRAGTPRQWLFMAKYVKNEDIDYLRQKILDNGDAEVNYHMACYIQRRYIQTPVNREFPERYTNYIYDYYQQKYGQDKAMLQSLVDEHIQKVVESEDSKFCYKTAKNVSTDNSHIKALEDVVLRACNVRYNIKFVLDVPLADVEAHRQVVYDNGTYEMMQLFDTVDSIRTQPASSDIKNAVRLKI